jgi:hypothetical protein
VFGVKVKQINTASGGTLNLVVKRDWQDLPNTNPSVGGSLVILDMNQLQYVTVNNRQHEAARQRGQGRQAPDADLFLEEWLTEFSLEMKFGGSQGGSRWRRCTRGCEASPANHPKRGPPARSGRPAYPLGV